MKTLDRKERPARSPLRAGTLRLIEEGHRFSAFYQGGLSNHLPLALVALDRLGAADERIAAFAARHEKRLEPLPPPLGPVTEANADGFLGRPEALASWIGFFEERIASAGAEPTAARWARRLIPGVGSVAFHGILRLAYALETGSPRELAHALAQWAAGYGTLGELPEPLGPGVSPAEALASLARDPGPPPTRHAGGRIAARMERARADERLPRLVALVGAAPLDLGELSRALLQAYAASGDFTILHGVTACHALRALLPLLGGDGLAQRYLWQALVCAYLSAGGPSAGSPLKGDPGRAWPEIRRRAAASDDEHQIKLAYSCWREWQAYGDDLYRRVASAALRA